MGQRLSALGALVSLIVSAGLALIGIALHLLAILIVTAGLLICVTSSWYVVSRRGARRIIALCVAAAALAGMIAGLVFAHINWLLLLAIVVLAALSVALARHALHRTVRDLRSKSVKAHRAQRPEQAVLIMNPKSGGGKAERSSSPTNAGNGGSSQFCCGPGTTCCSWPRTQWRGART